MSGVIENRLAELRIELPEVSESLANYVPYVKTGNLVILSGQVTIWNGELKYLGKIGADLTVEQGVDAARMCGLNMIAQVRAACDGDLDRVKRVVRLGGFVNGVEGFNDHSKILNGASDLMVEVFGARGRSARTAVGAALPVGFSVEIDGIFEIECALQIS